MGKTRKIDFDDNFVYNDLRQMKKIVRLQREDRHKREFHVEEGPRAYISESKGQISKGSR